MSSEGISSKLGSAFSKYAQHRRGRGTHLAQTSASTWIAMVTAIIGGFVALSTYRTDVSKRVDQSVEKTFDMIGPWTGATLNGPRTRVLSYVYARRACADANLCDGETAQAFFSPHANFQWPILERTVKEMSESSFAVRSDPNFALGMKSLAKDPVEPEPCNGNF